MPTGDWRVTMQTVEVGTGRLFDSTFCIHETEIAGPAGNLSASTVADDLDSWLSSSWRATVPNNVKLDVVRVRELGTTTPTAGEKLVNGLGTASAAGTVLPYFCCAFMSIKTALATRSGRGGFHFSWAYNAAMLASAAEFNPAHAVMVAYGTVLSALLAGHDVTHGIIGHHYSLRLWSPKHAQSFDVTQAKVNPQVKAVHSRMTIP